MAFALFKSLDTPNVGSVATARLTMSPDAIAVRPLKNNVVINGLRIDPSP
jgi:hypothetical protein